MKFILFFILALFKTSEIPCAEGENCDAIVKGKNKCKDEDCKEFPKVDKRDLNSEEKGTKKSALPNKPDSGKNLGSTQPADGNKTSSGEKSDNYKTTSEKMKIDGDKLKDNVQLEALKKFVDSSKGSNGQSLTEDIKKEIIDDLKDLNIDMLTLKIYDTTTEKFETDTLPSFINQVRGDGKILEEKKRAKLAEHLKLLNVSLSNIKFIENTSKDKEKSDNGHKPIDPTQMAALEKFVASSKDSNGQPLTENSKKEAIDDLKDLNIDMISLETYDTNPEENIRSDAIKDFLNKVKDSEKILSEKKKAKLTQHLKLLNVNISNIKFMVMKSKNEEKADNGRKSIDSSQMFALKKFINSAKDSNGVLLAENVKKEIIDDFDDLNINMLSLKEYSTKPDEKAQTDDINKILKDVKYDEKALTTEKKIKMTQHLKLLNVDISSLKILYEKIDAQQMAALNRFLSEVRDSKGDPLTEDLKKEIIEDFDNTNIDMLTLKSNTSSPDEETQKNAIANFLTKTTDNGKPLNQKGISKLTPHFNTLNLDMSNLKHRKSDINSSLRNEQSILGFIFFTYTFFHYI